jgi:hypothetical protein
MFRAGFTTGEAGVFDQVHQILLVKLNAANRINWSSAAIDGGCYFSRGLASLKICYEITADQPRTGWVLLNRVMSW